MKFDKVNRIYISGKITGMPNGNKGKFAAANLHLKQFVNFEVKNPHNFLHNHDKSWESYMKVCLKELCNADKVVVLDCWKQSRGAIREVLIAKWLNIPVVAIEDMEDVKIPFSILIKLLLNRI